MEFTLPVEPGEQMAFAAAAITAMMGLMMMLAPGFALRLLGFPRPEAETAPYSEMRSSLGGFYLGAGLSAILLAQPLIYFTLGAGFAIAAFARILSIVADRGATLRNYILLVVQLVLGGTMLGYFLGYI